jgi:hypothetical protein
MTNLLKSYAECIKSGDAVSIAALFAEDAQFNDQAPVKIGMQAINTQGRKNIEAFFRNVFQGGGLDISNVAVNGSAVRYDLKFGDQIILCLGVAEVKNNLIQKYKVIGI